MKQTHNGTGIPYGLSLARNVASLTIKKNSWYIWLTDNNSSECSSCNKLKGKIFQGKNLPTYPLHNGCRCKVEEISFATALKLLDIKNVNK